MESLCTIVPPGYRRTSFPHVVLVVVHFLQADEELSQKPDMNMEAAYSSMLLSTIPSFDAFVRPPFQKT